MLKTHQSKTNAVALKAKEAGYNDVSSYVRSKIL